MSQIVGPYTNGWAIDTTAPVDLSHPDKDVSEAPCELVCLDKSVLSDLSHCLPLTNS